MTGERIRLVEARPADLVFIAYTAVSGLLLLAFGWRLEPALWLGLSAAHVLLVVLGTWMARRQVNGVSAGGFLRETYPFLAVPFLYWELRHMARLFSAGYHDGVILRLEELLFGEQLAMTFSQAAPYLWLSEAMHLFYASYWPLVPFALIMLYVRRRLAGFRELVFVELVVFFACYLIYAFFPVAGPFYELPQIGPPLADGFFYGLVHGVLADGGSQGAAFPSSHVAVAVTVVLVAWRHDRALWLITTPVVAGLILGTVYGRFHYAVDALAGLLLAVALFPLALRLRRRLMPEDRAGPGATAPVARPSKHRSSEGT